MEKLDHASKSSVISPSYFHDHVLKNLAQNIPQRPPGKTGKKNERDSDFRGKDFLAPAEEV